MARRGNWADIPEDMYENEEAKEDADYSKVEVEPDVFRESYIRTQDEEGVTIKTRVTKKFKVSARGTRP